jgi:hypothetical protein
MFSEVAIALLEGRFVCRHSEPKAHAFLETEAGLADIEAWLSRIGRRVASTSGRAAFFMADVDGGASNPAPTKRAVETIRHEMGPALEFFRIALASLRTHDVVAPGYALRKTALDEAIDADPDLQTALRALATRFQGVSGDGSNAKVSGKVIKQMVNAGYLLPANAEREIYVVTGRIEHLDDVIAFVADNGGVPELDDAPRAVQEALL